MANIKLGTFNVKGLRNSKKRRKIFNFIHQKQFDIICLQETHSETRDEKYWKSTWGGTIYYAHGNRESRGVAILIKKKAPIIYQRHYSDPEGRFCLVDLIYENKRIVLANIYAPNKDTPTFFIDCFTKISEFEREIDAEKIIVGDFNLVLDIKLDKTGGRATTNRKAKDVLTSYLEDEGLIDIWRRDHPKVHAHTFSIQNPIPIYTRLDYIFVSASLADLVSNTDITPSFLSDHDIPTMVIKQQKNFKRGKGFWKLNTNLLNDQQYIKGIQDLIKEVKQEKLGDVPKWEWMKYKIRKYSIAYSSTQKKDKENRLLIYDKKLQQYKIELIELENTEERCIFTKENILYQIDKIQKDREELIEYKVRGAQIRSNCNWLMYGEKMSKYYFNLESSNYIRKNRQYIEKENGDKITDPKNVLKEQDNFYKKLYKETHQIKQDDFNKYVENLESPKLNEQERSTLEKEISMSELRKAIFVSKKEKVPGMDGLPNEFYQIFFNEIAGLLLKVCREIAINGLHVTARQCIIALIEKPGRNLDFLKNWRPLSLLNCDGKIYAKILAIRMEDVIEKLIHTDQSGFIKKRTIHDNLMDLLASLDYVKSSNEPYLLINVDLEKAFDYVNWDFVDYTLDFFNFGTNFRKMVRNTLENMTACTINYGMTKEHFKIEKGLRQGSPISTSLFDLVVEILGLKIRQERDLIGIQVENQQKKHAQYADDIWAIIKGSEESLNKLLQIFKDYAAIANLKMNFDKTQIIRLGNIANTNITYPTTEPLQWVKQTKILGLLISENRKEMLTANYEVLYKKMSQVLNPWKARSATLLGKILLINTLLASQTVYKFLILDTPPEKFFGKCKKLVTDFLWDGKKAKIAYTTLIKSIPLGGLKLTDLRTKEKALKLIWVKKATTSNNIWKSIANTMLPIPLEDMINANITKSDFSKINTSESTISSILSIWCVVSYEIPNSHLEVADQQLWFNSNIKDPTTERTFCFQKMYKAGITKIRDIYDFHTNKFMEFNELVYNYGNLGASGFLNYLALIKRIPEHWKSLLQSPPNDNNADNKLTEIWQLMSRTKVASGFYWYILNTKETEGYDHGYVTWKKELKSDIEKEDWEKVRQLAFKISTSTKLRYFQYRLLSKKLTTNVHRNIWDNSVSPLCALCKNDKETTIHLMLECETVKAFWKALFRWLKYICKYDSKPSAENIIFNDIKGLNREFVNTVILLAKHHIYVCKCKEEKLKLIDLTAKVHNLFILESNIAHRTNKVKTFKKKWKTYTQNAM